MRVRGAVVCAALAVVVEVQAKPPAARAPVHAVAPAPPLPMLPSVARVRVEAARDRVVVVEDVNLPRGDWSAGRLDLYVAFGVPGPPTAIDAHVGPLLQDALELRQEDAGEALSVEPAVRRMPSAQLLLGRPQMAGVVVHVREADLRRAYATSETAVLRIRSLLSAPSPDAHGARDVVVRLGIAGDLPLTLGRIQVVSLEGRPWMTRAEVHLCGPEAEGLPLAATLVVPRRAEASETAGPWIGPIAPAMAVRHASDDLCVRWWAEP
jgi:hypothetical protein